ncbi:MAG TPA: helix-turn-helix domain-containing protein [Bacteroidia bacterium]|nr:helix-turn-helix domain-containing protein [Bacteroidia bacterium]
MKTGNKEKPERRSGCPLSCSLDLIGDKWSLLIIRDMLFLEKTTYNEFLNSKEGISTNILNDRLVKLTEVGLISFTGTEKRKKYALTKMGLDLKPVLESIALFGMKYFISDKDHLREVKKVLNLK